MEMGKVMFQSVIVDQPTLEQVERTEREVAFVQTNQSKWVQRYWFNPGTGPTDREEYFEEGGELVLDEGECNSTGCIAGWTLAHEGYLIRSGRGLGEVFEITERVGRRIKVGQEVGQVGNVAAPLLGLKRDYTGSRFDVHPFHPENTMADLRLFARELRERYEANQVEAAG